jgi:hypothetical protein
MKIGLEYEGVLYKDNKIVRWKELPDEIKKHLNSHYNKTPIDNYDCLAEVRTYPMINPTAEFLLQELFNGIFSLAIRCKHYGIDIKWQECEISSDLHKVICIECIKDLYGANVDYGQTNKKITYVLDKITYKKDIWLSKQTDSFRGGGLHINISGLKENSLISWVKNMSPFINHYGDIWKSSYRNNILFRDRIIDGERVFEFISFGIKLPSFDEKLTFKDFFELAKHQFHWAQSVIDISKQYEEEKCVIL